MTGSHEVRGSIPLGSTNRIKKGPPIGGPKSFGERLTATDRPEDSWDNANIGKLASEIIRHYLSGA